MGLLRKGIMMDAADYKDYYVPAMDRHTMNDLGRYYQMDAFDKMLGVSIGDDYCRRHNALDEPLPDDWREFLAQLAGPYGEAILKAYRVKYNLEKDNEFAQT